MGERYFTLLEVQPKKDAVYEIRDRIYLGRGKRDRVSCVLRINYEELTSSARAELPAVLKEIVVNNQREFIQFFNTSQLVTMRMNSLEFIPGEGKGLMSQIIDQSEWVEFHDFDDLQSRVNIRKPRKLIARRILQGLEGNKKYNLFTRPSR